MCAPLDSVAYVGLGHTAHTTPQKGWCSMPLLGSRMPDYGPGPGNGKKSARTADVRPSFLGDAMAQSQGELSATVAMVLAANGAIFLGMPKAGNAILVRC